MVVGTLPKVYDTRKRSFLKALTANLVEIIIDTFVIGFILSYLGVPYEVAYLSGGGLAVLTELLCFCTNYIVDRIWNRTQWGREIVEES